MRSITERRKLVAAQQPLAQTADHHTIALAMLEHSVDRDAIAKAIRTQDAQLLLTAITNAVNDFGVEIWRDAYTDDTKNAGDEFSKIYNTALNAICDARVGIYKNNA